ncbi:MAG: hypothetical protein KDI36_08680 [Pseudomonadales bacterium]|nr:hypothetical protein [Pseudomonadales bacterium]
MPNKSVENLSQDMRKLADDVEHVVEDVKAIAGELGENLVGAEFLAAKEMSEELGARAAWLEQLEATTLSQWQLFQEDIADLLKESESVRQPEQLATTILKHLARRTQHQQLGRLELARVWQQEQLRLLDNHLTFTRSFMGLLTENR